MQDFVAHVHGRFRVGAATDAPMRTEAANVIVRKPNRMAEEKLLTWCAGWAESTGNAKLVGKIADFRQTTNAGWPVLACRRAAVRREADG